MSQSDPIAYESAHAVRSPVGHKACHGLHLLSFYWCSGAMKDTKHSAHSILSSTCVFCCVPSLQGLRTRCHNFNHLCEEMFHIGTARLLAYVRRMLIINNLQNDHSFVRGH